MPQRKKTTWPPDVHTLAIDIGGTGLKMLVLDARGRPVNERGRVTTPQPATPASVLGAQMVDQRVGVLAPGDIADADKGPRREPGSHQLLHLALVHAVAGHRRIDTQAREVDQVGVFVLHL